MSEQCNSTEAQQNTKHTGMATGTKSDSIEYKCALCKDPLDKSEDYDQHIAEHIEEIENMNVEILTNGHDLFECNLFYF